MAVPVGHWRDSLWDIFRYGYCHCSTWNACCCTLIAAGQVMQRLKLTQYTFASLVAILLSFWTTRMILFTAIAIVDPNTHAVEWVDPPKIYHILCAMDDFLWYAYTVFLVIVLRNLRRHVRSAYGIPTEHSYEDTCCSILCPCLVAGQMLRHTAEYDTYSGNCCSETGLSEAAPPIV